MKKKLIICAAMASLFVTGLTMQQAYGAETHPPAVVCEAARDLAYNVMRVRQQEHDRKLVEYLAPSDIGMAIVGKAYAISVAPDDEVEMVSKHFADFIKDECLKNEAKSVVGVPI